MRTTSLTVTLTPADIQTLRRWQLATTLPAARVRRARVILLLADGWTIARVARTVGLSRRHVYKWARRFAAQGVAGLVDLPRPGRWGTREPPP